MGRSQAVAAAAQAQFSADSGGSTGRTGSPGSATVAVPSELPFAHSLSRGFL